MLEYYEKAANLGNSYALFNLGNCFYNGIVTDQDAIKALEYYEKSAQLGNSDSMFSLGKYFYEGTLFEQSYSKSIEYLNITKKQLN